MSGQLSTNASRNIQAIVPAGVHKVLRDVAYSKGVPLRDLVREVIVEYSSTVSKETDATEKKEN